MKNVNASTLLLAALGGVLGTVAGIATANSIGKRETAKDFPKEKETFIGVATLGGIITYVKSADDMETIEADVKEFYGKVFHPDEDDARIFDSTGKEIKSLFNEEE
jgi:hypothetical protein